MKLSKISIVLIVLLVTAVSISLYFLTNRKAEKNAFINIQEVFKNFTYKKELEQKLKVVQDTRQNILDSLEMELKVLSKQVRLEKENTERIALFQTKREDFFEKKNQFEEDNNKIVKDFDGQIIKQLNQYVRDYGAKNNFKYIFGTDGSGSLMYADSTENITKEIILYVNERYKGGAK